MPKQLHVVDLILLRWSQQPFSELSCVTAFQDVHGILHDVLVAGTSTSKP